MPAPSWVRALLKGKHAPCFMPPVWLGASSKRTRSCQQPKTRPQQNLQRTTKMINLEEIEARAEAATPGPWEYSQNTPAMGGTQWQLRTTGKPGIRMAVNEYQHGPENAEFISHAREDIPALIARIRELEATVNRVREAFHPELGMLCADCLWEVETILDGTP